MALNAQPTQGVGVRDYLENIGYKVGYNPETKNVLVNGSEINSAGFNLNDGRYYANNTADIMNALKGANIGQPTANTGFNSPYQTTMQDITTKLMQPTQYSPQYGNDIASIINGLKGNKFTYNPNADMALKQAQGQAQQAVMDEMNDRGILNSTVTADRSSQAVAQLVPQYEQIARQNFNDEFNRNLQVVDLLNRFDEQNYQKGRDERQDLITTFDAISKLDDRAYDEYKLGLEQTYRDKIFNYNAEQDKINNERTKVADALTRVNTLGYVDNASSIVLGIPVGTPSAQAKAAADNRAFEIKMYEKELVDKKVMADKEYSRQVSLTKLRDQQKAQPQYTPEQERYYNTAYDDLLNRVGQENPKLALETLVKRRNNYIELMGEPLYERLLGELKTAVPMIGGPEKPNVNNIITSITADLDTLKPEEAYSELVKHKSEYIQDLGSADAYNQILNMYRNQIKDTNNLGLYEE